MKNKDTVEPIKDQQKKTESGQQPPSGKLKVLEATMSKSTSSMAMVLLCVWGRQDSLKSNQFQAGQF